MTEYTKYDSNHELECRNVRLAKDAQVINEGFVKVTFVLTSKNDKDSDIWVDAIPLEGGAALAAKLLKGDTLSVSGFLCMQKWGENDDKVSFQLKFAKLHYPIDLLVELKSRGDAPKKSGAGKAGPTKGKAAAKPPAKKAKEIVNLDEDDEDAGDIE